MLTNWQNKYPGQNHEGDMGIYCPTLFVVCEVCDTIFSSIFHRNGLVHHAINMRVRSILAMSKDRSDSEGYSVKEDGWGPQQEGHCWGHGGNRW